MKRQWRNLLLGGPVPRTKQQQTILQGIAQLEKLLVSKNLRILQDSKRIAELEAWLAHIGRTTPHKWLKQEVKELLDKSRR